MLVSLTVFGGVIAASSLDGREARADAPPPAELARDLSGRWEQSCAGEITCLPKVDIIRCASGWCGYRVSGNAECGERVLQLAASASQGLAEPGAFEGQVVLAAGSEPYIVAAYDDRQSAEGVRQLSMMGNTQGNFMMRQFEFRARFVRTGEPVCTAAKPAA